MSATFIAVAALGFVEGDASEVQRFVNAESDTWVSIAGRAEVARPFGASDATFGLTLRPIVVSLTVRTGMSAWDLDLGPGHYGLDWTRYLRAAPRGLEPFVSLGAGLFSFDLTPTGMQPGSTSGVGVNLDVGAHYNLLPWLMLQAAVSGAFSSVSYSTTTADVQSWLPAVTVYLGLGLRV